jgi:hypothetical protein
MGSRSGSEKNSYGSTTLTRAIYNILNDDQGRKKNGDTTKLN